jgi:hypothetical protein
VVFQKKKNSGGATVRKPMLYCMSNSFADELWDSMTLLSCVKIIMHEWMMSVSGLRCLIIYLFILMTCMSHMDVSFLGFCVIFIYY